VNKTRNDGQKVFDDRAIATQLVFISCSFSISEIALLSGLPWVFPGKRKGQGESRRAIPGDGN
jgi:hypothetical protein